MPPYLRDIAPGPHIIRFEADVAGTPVNMFFDHVQIEGETRLVISTYIGDPTAPPPPPCGPFRTRVTINGMAGATPVITTSPIASEPQVQELTLTTRPDSSGHLGAEVAERTVALVVQPGLEPRIEGNGIQWNALPDAASYRVVGGVIYETTCDLVRRLIFREESQRFDTELASSATSMAFPPPADPTLVRVQVDVDIDAYDSDNVLLAHQFVDWVRDYRTCWYAPGTEPLLSVEPTSGECDGEVTFRGSRFPTDVRVEIAMIAQGSDAPDGSVGTSAVSPDGTFALTTRLPTSACGLARLRACRERFSSPPTMPISRKGWTPSLLLGTSRRCAARGCVPSVAAPLPARPQVGGSEYRHRPLGDGMPWPLFAAFALASAGAVALAGGLVLLTRAAHRRQSSP